jgi:predicted DNA-binding transcriptional regulator YafY
MPSAPLTPSQRAAALLWALLCAGRASTAQLVQRSGQKREAVLRALKELAAVVPVVHEGEGREQRWALAPGAAVSALRLPDRLTLAWGSAMLRGLPLQSRLEPFGSVPEARHLDRKFSVKDEPWRDLRGSGPVIDTLVEALLRERRLHLRYTSAKGGEEAIEAAGPLSLVVWRRGLYLLIDQPARGKPWRALSVERIAEASLGEPFVWPEAWDPQAALRGQWGISAAGAAQTVRLRFEARALPAAQARQWHETACWSPEPDGRAELRLRVSGRELESWILEWGADVEVIEPPDLRAHIAAELRRAAARYA